ncbi:putative Phosphohistidine phosphatase SixA [Candidatus Desulfosporosinus infrequens]|uniref:Putative Phosphohistidine phosphatase SixA n=1 Tax=Candidatus Desulfosporosinus infrequens TaxID=2043169 RepID=A0A2U3K6Q5_9FIRM|nr:putative Phosphohistidine phosphatase SixA [Candidatus Desulfosporosinus infrequens]
MEVIFMRHGKAQDRELGLPDGERRLTVKGSNRVREVARALACGFVAGRNVQIWSSPLLRAKETAELLAVILKVKKVMIYSAIASENLDELLPDLLNQENNATIIIIGHEPYVGMWVTRMTKAVVPFRVASAAAVKVTSLAPPEGELRWFVDSGVLADIAEANC